MVLARSEKVLLIPSSAVLPAPYGDSIFLVEEGQAPDGSKALVARQQFVRLGERRGDFVVVTEGVKVGQKVVSTAPFRLRPGMPVVIDTKLAPEFSLEPKVKNT
jgi:membrane fusion protein, multidrug efflux system